MKHHEMPKVDCLSLSHLKLECLFMAYDTVTTAYPDASIRSVEYDRANGVFIFYTDVGEYVVSWHQPNVVIAHGPLKTR